MFHAILGRSKTRFLRFEKFLHRAEVAAIRLTLSLLLINFLIKLIRAELGF
jgi:hypothetical protein